MPVGKVTWVAKVGVAAPVAVVLSRMEACCCQCSPQLSQVSVAVDVADADGLGKLPVGK
jgi:hypothetical protein